MYICLLQANKYETGSVADAFFPIHNNNRCVHDYVSFDKTCSVALFVHRNMYQHEYTTESSLSTCYQTEGTPRKIDAFVMPRTMGIHVSTTQTTTTKSTP